MNIWANIIIESTEFGIFRVQWVYIVIFLAIQNSPIRFFRYCFQPIHVILIMLINKKLK